MMKTQIAAVALTMALGAGAMPAHADSHDTNMNFEMIFKMADKNKNSMVSRQEFLDAMGRAYDMGMKKMKGDSMMVKGSEMTRDGLKALIADIYRGA